MKEDKLEKFIRDHRQDFEDDCPSPEVWERISGQFPEGKRALQIAWKRVLRIAAVFLLGAISCAVFILLLMGNRDKNPSQKLQALQVFAHSKRDLMKDTSMHVEQKIVSEHGPHFAHKKDDKETEIEFPQEFRELQAYYLFEIERAKAEVFRFASDRPEIRQQVELEFVQFDSIYNGLKKDLRDNIENQDVIEAMILNYRVRLEILEMMLEQLKESTVENEKTKVYEI